MKYNIPKDFKSDGCTLAPNFNFKQCCIEHDYLRRYKIISKSKADKNLRECINSKGHPILAWIYWIFVRVAGVFYD